jgi:hypothetical protein
MPITLRTVCAAGRAAKSAPSPKPKASRSAMKPIAIPSICGMERLKPKFTPEAVSMMLFGPGVMEVTNAKEISDRSVSRGITSGRRRARWRRRRCG